MSAVRGRFLSARALHRCSAQIQIAESVGRESWCEGCSGHVHPRQRLLSAKQRTPLMSRRLVFPFFVIAAAACGPQEADISTSDDTTASAQDLWFLPFDGVQIA